ncbi:type VI secretion system baseplate subunit TssK [soil metagenome]
MWRPLKPLWAEGVFLGPEHLQQLDLYHESNAREAARLASGFPWGLHAFEIDHDALELGQLHALRLKVTFPDGETFDSAGPDRLPHARNLNELVPAGKSEVLVFAALPPLDPRAGNYRMGEAEGGRPRRYYREFEDVADMTNGNLGTQLAVARRNVSLMVEGEALDDFQTCPIAKLRRDSSGVLRLARDHVAPSVALGSSEMVVNILRRLHDMLLAKSHALSEQRRERSNQLVEFGAADVSLFWLLHTVNTAWPQVRHLLQNPALHPERAYLVLSELAAGLMTFAPEVSLQDLPAYRHADPTPHFAELDRILRTLLETVIPSRYLPVALELVRPSLYYGRLANEDLIDKADFYLSVHAAVASAELVAATTRVIKIGSPDEVEKLIVSALPGVTLQHMPRVPSSIPVKMDRHYFGLIADGAFYQRMLQSRTIAVYVPQALPDASIELMAVMKR